MDKKKTNLLTPHVMGQRGLKPIVIILDSDKFYAFYKKFHLIDLYTDVCYKQYLPIKHCSCSIVNSSWITYFYIFLTFDLITIRSFLKNYNTRIEYGQIFFKNN